jgi:hypothetical protein
MSEATFKPVLAMAAPKKNQNLPGWTDAGLQGGSFLLTIVQSAAQFAPVPYLQLAADSALFIVNTIAVSQYPSSQIYTSVI